MIKQGAVRALTIALFLIFSLSAMIMLGANASAENAFDPNEADSDMRENIKSSLAFVPSFISDVTNDPKRNLILDDDKTLQNLQKIYSNITDIRLVGQLFYPNPPSVGANEINVENLSVMIYYNYDGFDESYLIGGFRGSATAYILDGAAEDTTDQPEPEETTQLPPTEPQITDIYIKVNDRTVLYGEELGLSYEIENIPENITVVGEPVYSITGIPDVGEYEIALSGLSLAGEDAENYRINYVCGTLKIEPRKISVGVEDKSVIYGEKTPDFEIMLLSGTLASGDRLSDIIGNVGYSCEYRVGSPVTEGGYPIRVLPNYTVNKNYELEEIKNGVLEVLKRPVYILPCAAEKYDGEADHEFDYSYSGNLYAETPAFDGKLSRSAGEDIGVYDFSLGTLTLVDNPPFYAKNYEPVLASSAPKFEIKEKPFSVKLSAVSLTMRDRVHLTYRVKIGSELDPDDIISTGVLEWREDEYYERESYEYKDNAKFAFAGADITSLVEGRGIMPYEYMESFFCIVYAETEDGYIYSEPVRFSVAEYAEYIFQNHEKYQSVLPILISMLDYGTAAMNYCGTEADVFPNELVPDELRVEFDTKELSDAAKSSVESKKNQDIAIKGQIITPIGAYKIAADLHECLSLRLSLTLGGDIEGTVTLYYWNANDVIAQNDGKVLLDPSSAHILSTAAHQNKHTALIDGIPFVAANEIFYAAFAVTDNSGTCFGPVKVFSANFYAASLAEIYPDSETAKLAKALLAYTNEAEKYIESERDR